MIDGVGFGVPGHGSQYRRMAHSRLMLQQR